METGWNYGCDLFYDRQKTTTVKDDTGQTSNDQVRSEAWNGTPDDLTPVFEVADTATTFSVAYRPAFTFSAGDDFSEPRTGIGTLTPLTFDVSFEK